MAASVKGRYRTEKCFDPGGNCFIKAELPVSCPGPMVILGCHGIPYTPPTPGITGRGIS